MKLKNADGRAIVRHVVERSCATAGIHAGDELVALNGCRVGTDNLQVLADRLPLDGECSCYIFRDQR
jgi:predicted metalloprotease with PDZ domain